jgi:nicotinate-nucleotide adenylyltransferase
MSQRLGILGGTFDPPHVGHLILGEYAADALQLDRLLFVPAADPPHKRDEIHTPIEHRLALLAAAIADNPRFALSRVDVDRPGPHFSADMIHLLRDQYPGAELFFIMGADSLVSFPTWERSLEIMRVCTLAVMRRPGISFSSDMHETVLPGLAERITIIDAPLIDISSTHVAERLARGLSIRYLVTDPVRAYIEEHHLFSG